MYVIFGIAVEENPDIVAQIFSEVLICQCLFLHFRFRLVQELSVFIPAAVKQLPQFVLERIQFLHLLFDIAENPFEPKKQGEKQVKEKEEFKETVLEDDYQETQEFKEDSSEEVDSDYWDF